MLLVAACALFVAAQESALPRSDRDTFNYENAVVYNADTKRYEKYYPDRYNPNRVFEGRYNKYTGRWEPDYYGKFNPYTGRYDNDGRWFNPNTGRFADDGRWWNAATGRYEYENAKWFNPATGRFEYNSRYNPATGRYDYDDKRRYYNSQTGRYENDYPTRYNATTGRYDYDPSPNRRYNWVTGRYEYDYIHPYNPQTGQYDSQTGQYGYQFDRYINHPVFGRRYAKDYYGLGSVEAVHVPKVRYDNEQHWQTLRDVRVSDENGYHYSYETENAIRAAEDAHVVHKGTPHETLAKTGFYEYVGDDGKTYRVDYVADENGFHASVRY